MSRSITQYRVFIATPGGLEAERKAFRETLELYTASEAEPRGIAFHPVGWEDTLGGIGRPQELINDDLRQCDYAVFVWHDRWGSPAGNRTMVGTEEEWKLAEELYKLGQVRNIAVFFKNVDARQLRDPGKELKQVLAHKKRIEKEKRYLFKSYDQPDTFCDELRKHLARWLRDHEKSAGGAAIGDLAAPSVPKIMSAAPSTAAPEAPPPNFRYWIEETNQLLKARAADTATDSDAFFCARKALASGTSNLERAEAKYVLGICQFHLNKPADALATFSESAADFNSASDTDRRAWLAKALIGKGVTLGALGRREDEIAIYDDVIARFGAASELTLRESVQRALVNKGIALRWLDRNADAISVLDDVIDRLSAASESTLHKLVADALFNKGVTLGRLGRNEEEISVYDDVIARFGVASEQVLREQVANALYNKGVTLGLLGRREEEISVYDDVIARFGAASELALRERVAKALFNKGVTLGRLGRREEEISAYDDVIARFGAASELAFREQVAKALVHKGVTLGELGRGENAIAVYDYVIARFGAASELALRELVAMALYNKGVSSASSAGARKRFPSMRT